ncbi:MAG: hypothetical protein Q8O83_03775 [bacterium]|nr:hypothetical protein [bacterium]
MEHFICTGGCGGISGTPGVCQMDSCPHHGKDLVSCSCNDGEHSDAKTKAELEALRETEEGYEDTNKDEA